MANNHDESKLPIKAEDYVYQMKTCKPNPGIPVIDLFDPNAKKLIVDACQEFGFFKVVNHGVPIKLMTLLETLSIDFFNMSQFEKERAGSPPCLGYGNKKIGLNGDIGWIEYLLLKITPDFMSNISSKILPQDPNIFRHVAEEYTKAVKEMVCKVLEMAAEGLGIMEKDELSKLVRNEESDCLLRLNHYPPCPELQLELAKKGNYLLGFGEHTDPQIISAVRSNNTSGLQISLKDDEWVSVPSDDNLSFFLNVGDSLQVMTNGRFKSVKHRVLADSIKSRMSMIFFGGPPPNHKITALPSIMKEGEETLYKDFTWAEYKQSAYKTRLADNRLASFIKDD